MADTNSAAVMAASLPQNVETISLPGFGAASGETKFTPADWRVRYFKGDLDDPAAVADLEVIETKGLNGTEIVVLNKSSFTFMNQMFMVVTYLEKVDD